MDRQVYREMFGNEDQHWWFVARRKILQKIFCAYFAESAGSILEVGCGTGGNLGFLATRGDIQGMELDDEALEMANSRNICPVRKGLLPDYIPFEQSFDLICMLDVLEHIDDEPGALRAVRKKLNQEGKILITVPAYMFLWSAHDVAHQHKRRYRKEQILGLVKEAGFRVVYSTYFNSMLFPVISLTRMINNVLGRECVSDVEMPSKTFNNMLMKIFSSERFFMPIFSFPFGVSILVVAEKSGP